MKKKVKSNIELMKEIRKSWTINPITRVHDDNKRNKKWQRKEGKDIARNYFKSES